jgi:hypothetical protein
MKIILYLAKDMANYYNIIILKEKEEKKKAVVIHMFHV